MVLEQLLISIVGVPSRSNLFVRLAEVRSSIVVAIITGLLWLTTHKACDQAVQVQLTQMAINGSGVLDTTRMLHISQNKVSDQLKKASLGKGES